MREFLIIMAICAVNIIYWMFIKQDRQKEKTSIGEILEKKTKQK